MAQDGSRSLSGAPTSFIDSPGSVHDVSWSHQQRHRSRRHAAKFHAYRGHRHTGRNLTVPTQEGQRAHTDQASNSTFFRNLFATMIEAGRQKLVGTTTQEEFADMFTVEVLLPDGIIKPEDMKISMKDRVMTLEAKKEELSEDGTCRHYQECSKKIKIPNDVKLEEVKSVVQPNGVLRIQAPLLGSHAENPLKSTEIPIHVHTD